ncbi:hypothetical protein M501DRAFT_931876 [Patellaria atrata CBS 101060]|uniref:Sm domain-containing protein n=1 Tax=Patellaria atrata CBS 101060 TaxID=1346257 RepID=A0A9P4VSI9_9PEZI|nr:hypothetical protein M501DRAFT_931876 [Patellaria atrata CBS 101060]
MDNAEATTYLSQYLGKSLRIHILDGRIFVGQMKCTDGDCNIILSLTYEYRQPSPNAIREAIESSENSSTLITLSSRFVGLVVVPGQYIQKIEYEETGRASGQYVVP